MPRQSQWSLQSNIPKVKYLCILLPVKKKSKLPQYYVRREALCKNPCKHSNLYTLCKLKLWLTPGQDLNCQSTILTTTPLNRCYNLQEHEWKNKEVTM